MIDITKDIQPLTTFRNNSVKMMQRLKKIRSPIILTINGKPESVVQDAAAYQRLLDIAATLDANEGIRQELEELHRGAHDIFNPTKAWIADSASISETPHDAALQKPEWHIRCSRVRIWRSPYRYRV